MIALDLPFAFGYAGSAAPFGLDPAISGRLHGLSPYRFMGPACASCWTARYTYSRPPPLEFIRSIKREARAEKAINADIDKFRRA